MAEYLIVNGYVYDPMNGIFGEEKEIAVKDGLIADPRELSPDAEVIDAQGGIVVPGGIDIHAHIAGPKVNTGRLLQPSDHIKTSKPSSGILRSETGRVVPNVFKIGYEYARMGYTTVAEAASPPLEARHTHEELNDIPIIDKLTYIVADSSWFLLDFISEGRKDLVTAYVGWLLQATKGYGIKIVDPGADWAWLHGVSGVDIDTELPEYGVTPRDILSSLGEAAEELKLPHPIHVHCNRLGYPGNYESTIRTLELSLKYGRGLDRPAMHITHIQFTGYKGDSWITLGSGGEEIAREVERADASVDLGQLVFGSTLTMTADAPFEYVLYHLQRGKWSFADVEAETSAGIVPYVYRKRNFVNTIQWCIGLEVALLVKDPWKVYLTTDHPNAGPFTKYPEIMALLMSKRFREKVLGELNQAALGRTALPSIDRELTLDELITMTRSAPAKLLGMKFKGHLGEGAQADIAIYDLNPRDIDVHTDYEKVIRAFSRAKYTIKDGKIVVRNGEVVETTYGSTYFANPRVKEDALKELERILRDNFPKYYSVALSNYMVGSDEIRRLREVS